MDLIEALRSREGKIKATQFQRRLYGGVRKRPAGSARQLELTLPAVWIVARSSKCEIGLCSDAAVQLISVGRNATV